MKSVLGFSLVFFVQLSFVNGQTNIFNGTIAYLELGGLGGGYTFNLEHSLFKTRKWFGQGRIGYGQYNFISPQHAFRGVPLSLNFFNYSSNHHTELGAGVSFIEGMNRSLDDDQVSRSMYVAPVFGYRYQRPGGGLFLKVQYLPMVKVVEFTKEPIYKKNVGKVVHYPGLSIGYFFSKKK